jgi:hypothetical protein
MRPVLILALLALPAPAADNPITIKLKLHPEPGKAINVTSRHVDRGSTRIEGPDGKVLVDHEPGGSETVKTTTVLEADRDGVPTKYLRTYKTATETEDGKTRTYSYQGRTLLFEKGKDGKLRVGVVGPGELDRRDAEKLLEKANESSESAALMRQFAPDKPVRPGDSWPLGVKLVGRVLDMKVDEAKSSAMVKLLRVSRRDAAPVGTFELDVSLAVTGTTGKVALSFDPPMSLTMKGTVEMVIDGTSTAVKADMATGMKGSGTWKNASGATGKIVFDVSGTVADAESAEVTTTVGKLPAVTWLKGPGEWAAFKPKHGLFTAEFPGAPKEATRKGSRGGESVTWTVEADGGSVAYTAVVTDLAADVSKLDPRRFLRAIADDQKGARDVTDVRIDGHTGIEFRQTETVGGKAVELRHRVVLVNGWLLQQIAIAEKGKGKPADADRFFQSLKILAKPTPRDD